MPALPPIAICAERCPPASPSNYTKPPSPPCKCLTPRTSTRNCEFILVRSGTIEFTCGSEVHLLPAGSVGLTAPNEMHGFRKPGPGDATYFIVSVGKH